MRSERSLRVLPANSDALPSYLSSPVVEGCVGGISCAFSFPVFHALFTVGLFENSIQTYSLMEVQGCALPEDYIYNGYKTVRLTLSAASYVSRAAGCGGGCLEGGNHAAI
ncbi:hypothetical protein TraAM80_00244 [Trypanosoma rangeli]|uniref:Uncharacterized protein n=1 Tax=Trypanosoma rangeli TaxID=5698 RepID=A0A422P488_TRYRA|nr:uncharacterized protein TraAM80_00244 [Trypanosoma rangeli]RNF12528.1 hypothetical protein TraAM80_00244 [Trypanosoma rangeli]|eukprot:RNF12528.1 hypothetical protein TraAM80_00244 [Trypanosoma rangeli]